MSSAYFLSEDDVKLLKEMANSYRQGTVENRKYRYSVYTEEAQSQDVHLVIPETTIDAISDLSVSSGLCQVQTIVDNQIAEIGNIPVEVYNLRQDALEAGTPYLAVKTKHGKWIVSGSKGNSTYIVQFEIISKVGLGTGTGTDSPDLPAGVQVARVVNSAYGMTNIPDIDAGRILVYDTSGCFFNESDEALLCRIGYAVYMKQEGLDPDVVLRDGTGTGTGTGLESVNLAGKWEVISLCCAAV